MPERSEELAQQFERVTAEFVTVAERLSDAQWRLVCPNEERTVGVLTRHVAAGIPFEMVVFRQIAAGQQPETISRADLAEINARDAEAWVDSPQDETLALLRGNAAAAAAELRTLSDEQLRRTGKYITELPDNWTVETWIERVLIGHLTGHLESIRAAVAANTNR